MANYDYRIDNTDTGLVAVMLVDGVEVERFEGREMDTVLGYAVGWLLEQQEKEDANE